MVFEPFIIGFSFLPALLFPLLFYLVGWVIRWLWLGRGVGSILTIPHSYTFFLTLLGGMIFIISLYAIIITKGNSSLAPVPILCLALLRMEMPHGTHAQRGWENPLLFFLIALFLYWAYMMLHYLPTREQVNYIGGDISFYARAGEWLNAKGEENVSIYPPGFSGPSKEPYHYGDIWGIAFLQKITGLHPILVTTLIWYPLCLAIFLSGVWSWINARSGLHSNLAQLIVLVGGFISGLAILFPQFLVPGLSYALPVIYFTKLAYASVFIIGIGWSLQSRLWQHTILLMTLCCILYMNIAAPLFFVVLMLYLYSKFVLADPATLPVMPAWLLCGAALAYYILFYWFSPSSGLNTAGFSVEVVMNILGGGLLQIVPLIPFILLGLVIMGKKKFTLLWRKPDLIFFVALVITGFACWAVFYWVSPESIQFFSNVFIPVQAILIMLIVVKTLQQPSKPIRFIALSLFFLSVALNIRTTWGNEAVSASDYKATQSFLERHGHGSFVNFRDTSEFQEHERNTMVYPPLSFIYYLQRPYFNSSMNTGQLQPVGDGIYQKSEQQLLSQSPFMQFMTQQVSGKDFDVYASEFARKYQVRYLMTSPRSRLPSFIKNWVNDSVVLNSGWRIYSLPVSFISN